MDNNYLTMYDLTMYDLVHYLKSKGYNVPMKPLRKVNQKMIIANGTKPYISISNGNKIAYMVNPETGVQVKITAQPRCNFVTNISALGQKPSTRKQFIDALMTPSGIDEVQYVYANTRRQVKKIAKDNESLFYRRLM